jgi:hypothetical protein
MSEAPSIFKALELEKQYMGVYEAVLGLWSVPHEALDVATRFGTTHINASGPENAPAMVLLPGFGPNSTQWFPNIAALSSQFRVYALDTIGQPGKSVPSGMLSASSSSELLIAGRSVIYNPNRALRRTTRLMPNFEAEIIPDASHALNNRPPIGRQNA